MIISPRRIAKSVLPVRVLEWLRLQVAPWPPVGWVRFGGLRRVTPVSRVFGFDRGQSIDRYYIERFLAGRGADIQRRVLEVSTNTYTMRFGGDRVTKSDVLHVDNTNPDATIVADLCSNGIPSDTFDCIILTQTLPFIFDTRAALSTLYRILAPGGVLLATFPGISQISRYDMDRWGDYWRFTTLSARRLFEEVFPKAMLEIEAHGNVFAATSFLHGLAVQDVRQEELDHRDPDYEMVITVRAVKPKDTM